MQPLYIELYKSGELKKRVEEARSQLVRCELCPRRCRVNRLSGQVGKCRTGARAVVSSFGPHFGEEAPLVGKYGSGTIFFTHCNLRCCFCQNYTISQLGEGEEVSPQELAYMMLSLQARGCHNINLVTPTHVGPQILEALEIAITRGLTIPLVYNSGGYDSVDTLKLLEGVVDIYMPDMKYVDSQNALKYSGVKGYPQINQEAVKEMYRQVGDLIIDNEGIAQRGLLIRHLVLPHDIAGTKEIVEFIAQEISPNSYVNIMDQYHPCYKAFEYPELSRPLTNNEFNYAVKLAREAGLTRLDHLLFPKEVFRFFIFR